MNMPDEILRWKTLCREVRRQLKEVTVVSGWRGHVAAGWQSSSLRVLLFYDEENRRILYSLWTDQRIISVHRQINGRITRAPVNSSTLAVQNNQNF